MSALGGLLANLSRRHRLGLLAAVVLLVVAVVACSNWGSPVPKTVTRNEVTQIHALGRLEPSTTVLKISPASGNEGTRIDSLSVAEGDDVEKDAVLAVLDNYGRRQAALGQAEARWQAAEAKLVQVKIGAKEGDIEAQRAACDLLAEQLRVLQVELTRAKELREKSVVTQEEFDQRKWSYDKTYLEHRRAQQILASISEIRATDVQIAVQEVKAAEAAVVQARADLAASQVRASAAGRILKIHTREGEKMSDRGLLEMGDVRRMHAVAEVFEGDLLKLRTGLAASVRVDSTGEVFEGTVQQLGHLVGRKVVVTNDPVSDTDARVVEVRVELSEVDSKKVARLSNARIEVTISLGQQVADREASSTATDPAREETRGAEPRAP